LEENRWKNNEEEKRGWEIWEEKKKERVDDMLKN
jgi:hypothetical protein